jgi:hypothetical protein
VLRGTTTDGKCFLTACPNNRYVQAVCVARPDTAPVVIPGGGSHLYRASLQTSKAISIVLHDTHTNPPREWSLIVLPGFQQSWQTVMLLPSDVEFPAQLSLVGGDRAVLSVGAEITSINLDTGERTVLGTGRWASMTDDGVYLSFASRDEHLSVVHRPSGKEVFRSSRPVEGGVEWAPGTAVGVVSAKFRFPGPKLMPGRQLYVVDAAAGTWRSLGAYRPYAGTSGLRWIEAGDDPCSALYSLRERADGASPAKP